MLQLLMLRQNHPRIQARQEHKAQRGGVHKRAMKDRHAQLFKLNKLNDKILDSAS